MPLRRHRPRDLKLILEGHGRREFWAHVTAREVRAWLPRSTWRNYHKFCVERNPWDRAISLYWWTHQDAGTEPLIEFLRTVSQERISNLASYAIDGDIVVDRVMRYEDLDQEIEELSRELRLQRPLLLPRAKSGSRRDRRPYRDILGPEERSVISRRCAREIELFGYEF